MKMLFAHPKHPFALIKSHCIVWALTTAVGKRFRRQQTEALPGTSGNATLHLPIGQGNDVLRPQEELPLYFAQDLGDHTSKTYNRTMYTVAETEIFTADAKSLWSEAERLEFITWIAGNALAGEVIPGSGGCRKVRWSRAGVGKRGGLLQSSEQRRDLVVGDLCQGGARQYTDTSA